LSEPPDFWYLLGWDYEVTVYKTREEAEAAKAELPSDIGLYEGWFGVEFNAWIGRHFEG